jgi:hypothetical protein
LATKISRHTWEDSSGLVSLLLHSYYEVVINVEGNIACCRKEVGGDMNEQFTCFLFLITIEMMIDERFNLAHCYYRKVIL